MALPLDSISESVLFKNKDSDLSFNNYSDLAGLRLGVIEGYSYSGGFMDKKEFTRVPAKSNETNLKRVAEKNLDLCICDKFAGVYMAQQLNIQKDLGYFNKAVNRSELCIGFSKTGENLLLHKEYDIVLKEMKQNGTYDKIIKKYS
jgi:polar amino acid transport system substrate-binding protein